MLLACPGGALAQSVAPPQAVPDQSLDTMPDIGLDWPDMGQEDRVKPLPADPADTQVATPDAVPDAAQPVEPVEEAATFADTGEERRYTVQLNGIDTIADATFKQRFDELSALRQGDGKPPTSRRLIVASKRIMNCWTGCCAPRAIMPRASGARLPRRQRAVIGWPSASTLSPARNICSIRSI